jgi:hypothetical protein
MRALDTEEIPNSPKGRIGCNKLGILHLKEIILDQFCDRIPLFRYSDSYRTKKKLLLIPSGQRLKQF